ncbi:hypothetical protein [Janthinobacterium sp. RA13]|uniref:hypothetical protein n=1 Tax=Janthinobacterium sp. RA13 TaxID=1502762 RepID=UPI000567A492|nr:hypothetical protein [Janthinobacterium sp. RA13]
MMDFVDLERHFAPICKDKDEELDWSLHLGRKYGNWLNWAELLERRRVVLLAEALCGKTKELEQRAIMQRGQGHPAFYVRIEDLIDRGFIAALRTDDAQLFDTWKQSKTGDAWFFLDSVDEARINNKSFPGALRTLSNELGNDSLNRAFIIVSCRVSDWKGKSDREAIETELPFVDNNLACHDRDEILLGPIFDKHTIQTNTASWGEVPRSSNLLVVQLVPLTDEQKLKMADAAKIDGLALLQAINQSGLDAMAERPGDFIDLIAYWAEHSRLASLIEMTAAGVRRKLREENQHRAGLLSPERAMDGAMRLAAALVFAKTFALKAPGQEPDITLSKGAINPSDILDDWPPHEVNALLRTGVFAPSTYGRIKFHHRTTQEFLAACWLRTLLEHNCPISEIKRLLFADPYGAKTAVPSLLAVTAWLSQWVPEVCHELIEREPVALIVHGDPKSLSLQARGALLKSYAHLDAAGRLDYEYIDNRAAWMFSNAALANAIKLAWQANSKAGFRLHLLHFIEEGRVEACVHLARQAACDQSQDDMRIAATRAMVVCNDHSGLKKIARQLIAEPDRLNAHLAPRLAELLYPNYLNTTGLLMLIDRSQQARKFSSDGFASYLATLHKQTPSRPDKKRLVAGIADLVLGSDRRNAPNETVPRYAELCKGIAELANVEFTICGQGEVEEGMLRLLMAVERVLDYYHDDAALPVLKDRVRGDKQLNRQLMWADAAAWRSRPATDHPIVHFCQIGPFYSRTLWGTDASDLEWLLDDAQKMCSEDDRRIAFSALWHALKADEVSPLRMCLDRLASGDLVLGRDLAEFLKPREPDVYVQKQLEAELEEKQKTAKAKQSWIDFREELRKTPAILDHADALTSWSGGLHRLYYLTTWLKKRAAKDGKSGVLSYSLFNGVFDPEVINHYAAGMRQVWRLSKPIRPDVSGISRTFTRSSRLALDALALDCQSSDWATDLSDADAKIAVRHAMIAGTIKSAWVDKLIMARPEIVLLEIVAALQYEFGANNQVNDILSNAAYHDVPGQQIVTEKVFQHLKRREPTDKQTLDYCSRIVARHVDFLARKGVIALAQQRLLVHMASGDDERIFVYLRILASVDGDGLARLVLTQLVRTSAESKPEFELRVQHWLGRLFDCHTSGGVAFVALHSMRLELLAKLLKLAYRHVRPRDDRTSESDSTVSRRDLAESARNSLLSEVMARREADAYDVLMQMAGSPEYAPHAMRFSELAHRKAHADADVDPWTVAEVNDFGRLHVAPVKNGEQLLRLAMAVLSDITASFDCADASSRSLLALADDEEKVQQWLTERLNDLSKARYHTYREPKVANSKEPDIVVSSTSCPAQIAIEIKNANKGWTVKQYEAAVSKQLASLYLLPQNRRHGILVISLHEFRKWRIDGRYRNFDQLILHLTDYAAQVTSNKMGAVVVKVVGINAWRPK